MIRGVVLGWMLAVGGAGAAGVEWKESGEGSGSMVVDDKLCWSYQAVTAEGKPCFPVLAIPGSGEVFTMFRPVDHRWHLGFWFSWKFINGTNFWEPDTNGVTRLVEHSSVPTGNNGMEFKSTLSYLAKGREVVREQRSVKVVTESSGNYTIEWDASFSALDSEVVFAATESKRNSGGVWVSGGYGGLTFRLAGGGEFEYSFGNDGDKKDVHTCGESSAKFEIVARSLKSGASARVVIEDHPENPRYPCAWFVRHNAAALKGEGYYAVGPGLLFHEPLKLEGGGVMRLRYKVSVER